MATKTKARLKTAKQQTKRDTAAFLCDVSTLARCAYREFAEEIDTMVFSRSVKRLSDRTLRGDLRKSKLQTVDGTLTVTVKLMVFLEHENGNSTDTEC